MRLRVVLALLLTCLLGSFLVAQVDSVPPPPQLTQDRLLLEIGALQAQLSGAQEYIRTLQDRVRQLSAENAKLKADQEK